MSGVRLQIGGHLLAVTGSSASFFERYDGCRPFAVADAEAEWEVRYDVPLEVWNDVRLLNRFAVADTGGQCCFERGTAGYQFRMFDADGTMLLCMHHSAGSRLVEATSCSDATALRFSLWFAFSMLTPSVGLSFVHSSTVVCKDKAVMFLGESGTGKSTHSRLWLQHIPHVKLLNDDSPLLAISAQQGVMPRVYGTPWSGKTPCYHAADFELAAVVRLSQAGRNQMRRLRTIEAFGALQPSLPPALMQDVDYTDLLVEILSRTLAAVPFYHLECLPDADAALLCHDSIFNS